MKHPILYRSIFYSILVLLCGSVLFLLSVMNGAPFKSIDMRNAYMYGCQFGARPLTEEKIAECLEISDKFKNTLDDLDRQIDQMNGDI